MSVFGTSTVPTASGNGNPPVESVTIHPEEKAELFRHLLLESGTGAKTNVGFGRLSETAVSPNVIGYNLDAYREMDKIMQARAAERQTRPGRNAAGAAGTLDVSNTDKRAHYAS